MPLSAAFVSAAIDLTADILPLLAWKRIASSTASGDDGSDDVLDADDAVKEFNYGHVGDLEVLRDPVTYACSVAFAGALYSFIFVQACRLFLPSTFVVHFLGIATVEPARTLPVSATFPPSFYEVAMAVFLSWPAVLLSLVCGGAAYSFIFTEADLPPPSSPTYKKSVVVRAAALSLAVSTNVFLQCFLDVRGIDAVGAGTYASVWAAAPLLVGPALGLARA